jgi:hypothetical protein
MWDEREDFDDEKVQRTRYVHCGLMVFKNQLSILFVNLSCILVALPQGFGYILLKNEMVRRKM